MKKKHSNLVATRPAGNKTTEDFRALSHQILHYASRGVPRINFLEGVSRMLKDFSGCDAVEIRLKDNEDPIRFEFMRRTNRTFNFEIMRCVQHEDGTITCPVEGGSNDSERLCGDIMCGRVKPSLPFFTDKGSFWSGENGLSSTSRRNRGPELGGSYSSITIIPLSVANENIGLLQLKSKKPNYFIQSEIEAYERVARNLGVALIYQRAQAALRERVKELTCLHGIAQVSAQPDISLHEILERIVQLLPPAWQYPEITSARITVHGRSYSTSGFKDYPQKETADIIVQGEKRGVVEIVYSQKKPELDEGPFLREERRLIDAVAKQVVLIVERKKAEEDRVHLQDQLRHADRLATIGQLAAGIAHELNEPLGTILGFAQLTKKSSGLSEQTRKDIERIEMASLHAREVIRKLMMFARQMPSKRTKVNLNSLVEDGLYFLESRCVKEGIKLVRVLSPGLPDVTVDPAQLHQVLVNLAVNAIHAMPDGGKLIVQTASSKDYVSLIIEDTGIGMSKEVLKQIFIPFFTTKDVGQGTGLGLPVVHGIVTSHGGSIKVESKPGQGARFEVQLPVAELEDTEESDQNDDCC
ncbi:hypothetical protein E3J38_01085 [candidate division TA06 bacterium]|uniref:histidine kinase n=1 Tax=candidate division TA06 bacterium TaxID=2250710 RepID=A0A523XUT4_UNCT6|nr:MAG: hypothetical protein E3J38_01085 [candidate division TA06 bacterium]